MTHINKGNPFPLGSSLTSQGVNFSLIATNAEYVEILLFEQEDSISPKTIFKLDQNHNTGPYWHVEIKNLNEGCIYAFRIKQKNNEINNNYEKKVLLDPCSSCLLYTSDAADEGLGVDLGGRRIIKKKTQNLRFH